MSGSAATNTSATGGYIVQRPPPPPTADDFQVGVQGQLVALSGLPGNLVRPQFQGTPPVQPPIDTTWASFGLVMTESDDYPYFLHVGSDTLAGETNPGYTIIQRHMTLTVHVVFYGPEAEDVAGAVRDGLYIGQNYEPLLALGLKLRTVHDLARVPELINQQYLNRVDLRIEYRVMIERVLPIFDLSGADVHITDGDSGTEVDVSLSEGMSPPTWEP